MKIKRMHPGLTSLILFCIALCLIAPPAFSQGNIHFGRLKVNPSISYKAEFDDNIYTANTNEIDDYVSTVNPKVVFSYDGSSEGNYLRFGYDADIVFYEDLTDNNYVAQRPFIEVGFKSPAGLYFTASDRYFSSEDPAGSENTYNLGIFTSRYTNTASVLAGYAFNRYAVEVFYTNYLMDFEAARDDWQDQKDNRYGVNLVYNYSPKTSLYLQYKYTDAVFENQEDGINMVLFGDSGVFNASNAQNYDKNDFSVGARFNPSGKLSGGVKLGFGDINHENTLTKDGLTYEDSSTWTAGTNVTYQASQRTSLTLNLRRAIRNAPEVSIQTASDFYDTFVGLTLNQKFANRIQMTLGASWNNNDYQDEQPGFPELEYDTWRYNIGFSYQPKDWFTASVGLDFEDKEATETFYQGAEYDKTVFWFKLAAAF